jgi:hypothetical protein
MSEFREFMQETKSSLLDLDVLLQRAKSQTTVPSERMASSSEPHHTPFDAIMSAIEELSKRLREREALQQTERRDLYLQMEKGRVKIQRAIDQLEARLGCRPDHHSEVQRAQHQDLCTLSNNGRADRDGLSVGEYLSEGELLLQSNQYKACFELMTVALTEHPGTEAIHDLARECRRRLEDQQLQEEMFVYLENLKKETIEQFDRGQFQKCVKTFAFYVNLNPTIGCCRST